MTSRAILVAIVTASLLGCTSNDEGESDSTDVSTTDPQPSVASVPATDPAPDVDDIGPIPPGAAGEATGPLGSTEVRIDTDAGTVQIGSGSVPERLGADFPLPSDFVLQLASETATDVGFSGTTDWTMDELIALFTAGLPAAGFPVESIDRRGTALAVLEFSSGGGVGTVAISEAPGSAAYMVIVTFGGGSGDDAPPEN